MTESLSVSTSEPQSPPEAPADRPARRRTGDRLRGRSDLLVLTVLVVAYGAFVWLSAALMQVNSDKVWPQTIMLLRGDYGRTSILASPDTFFLKYPLYMLSQHLFGATFSALVFEVVVMNVVFFASIAASYALLVRYGVLARARWWVVLLAGLWTISVGDPTGPLTDAVNQPTVTLIHPNERNMELGLAILVLVLAGLLYLDRLGTRLATGWRLLAGALLALAAGGLWYDDPYSGYIMLAPLAIAGLVRALAADSIRAALADRRWQVWYFLGATVVVHQIAARIGEHIGIHPYTNTDLGMRFVDGDQLGAVAGGLLHSVAAVYDGSFFGTELNSSWSFQLLLNAVGGVAVVACGLSLLRGWHRPGNHVRALLPVAALVITAAFVITGVAANQGDVRYLIVFIPVFFLLLPTALVRLSASPRGRVLARAIGLLLVVSLGFNIAHTASSSSKALGGPNVNADIAARARTIAALGLTKGYAEYWDADVNTYTSKGKELTIGVRCVERKLRVYYWLIDESWLRKRASTSFYIFNPHAVGTRGCGPYSLHRQFGSPVETVALDHDRQLYVYDYDILRRMPPRTDPTKS